MNFLLFFLGASLDKNLRILGFARTKFKSDKYDFPTNPLLAPMEVKYPLKNPNPPSSWPRSVL